MAVLCPIACLEACPEETWLQQHESTVLAFTATFAAMFGLCLQCILYSRCTRIQARCCGFHTDLERDVVNDPPPLRSIGIGSDEVGGEGETL